MNGFSLWKQEWSHIFKSKKILIPVIAILFIPIMYTGMFLWAFWDPYARLNDLPVAVVNLDEGAELQGNKIEVGNELVKELKKDGTFQFHFVSKSEADKGMANEKYYMEIYIPKNTSENAATVLSDEPKQVELKYIPNEGYNFLSGQIGSTAVTKIQEKVGNTLSKAYVSELLAVGSGLTEAADGSTQITDGVKTANKGSKELAGHLKELSSKMIVFENGANDAKNGAGTLAAGMQSLDSNFKKLIEGQQALQSGSEQLQSGTVDLQKGLQKLSDGAEKMNAQVPSLVEGTKKLNNGAGNLENGVETVQSSLGDLQKGSSDLAAGLEQLQKSMAPLLATLPDEQRALLEKQIAQLAAGGKTLNGGLTQLTQSHGAIVQGAKELSAGTKQLAGSSELLAGGMSQIVQGQKAALAGSNTLLAGQTKVTDGLKEMGSKMVAGQEGIEALAKGSIDLQTGLVKIGDGASQFATASNKLYDGSKTLSSGLNKIEDGSSELSSKLTDASDQLNKDDETKGKIENMMSDPISFTTEAYSKVPNYGTGFAPYFLSLGLFVGALLTSIVFPFRESINVPKRAGSWFISKFGVLAIISFIQSLITSILLVTLLDLQLEHFGLFVIVGMFTSMVFMTLIQFFVTAFADAGRFVAIVILILQLTSSAGTFPLETVPASLQVVNHFLPMTYSVAAYKAVISTHDLSVMWSNVGVLGGFILLFVAGTLGYMTIAWKKRYSKTTTIVGSEG